MKRGRTPHPPVVGILGGGQLGRMLGIAARNLDISCRFYETRSGPPAAAVGDVIDGRFDDFNGLDTFAEGLEVASYEFENVPVAATRHIARLAPVRPAPRALEIAQDRLAEKRFFRELGELTTPFAAVDSRGDLDQAIAEIGLPAVLKTRRLGYDGRGQAVLASTGDAESAWSSFAGVPMILEGWVAFERELSILAVRGGDGTVVHYPLIQNRHHEGILRTSVAPAPGVPTELAEAARTCATRALEALDYVGVLAIELFDTGGRLLVSEMAPRVHNSGHWTIDGATTSQFENHIRAILDLPLGRADAIGHAGMVNIIGEMPDRADILSVPGAHLHHYGKSPRPGRKLGHINLRADSADEVAAAMQRIERIVAGDDDRPPPASS